MRVAYAPGGALVSLNVPCYGKVLFGVILERLLIVGRSNGYLISKRKSDMLGERHEDPVTFRLIYSQIGLK